MARYTGPSCRLCRREGIKLYLKGERCYTEKCSVDRRSYAPGQHGQRRRGKYSSTACSCGKNKKPAAFMVCWKNSFAGISRKLTGARVLQGRTYCRFWSHGWIILFIAWVCSFALEARQLVRHGHFTVNGQKVTIPFLPVSPVML